MCSRGGRGPTGEEGSQEQNGPSLGGSSSPHLRQPNLTPQRTRSSFIPTLNSPPTPHSSLAPERKARWGAEGRRPLVLG